jgi:hypothetical protein|tara:strand:- start:263 stop:499 length:237 start_codon:yes stop_codon:yes gene_type:complete
MTSNSQNEYLDYTVNINDQDWRVAEKRFRFGKEWQYTLQYEDTSGGYHTMYLNEEALKNIIMSGSKIIDESFEESKNK